MRIWRLRDRGWKQRGMASVIHVYSIEDKQLDIK